MKKKLKKLLPVAVFTLIMGAPFPVYAMKGGKSDKPAEEKQETKQETTAVDVETSEKDLEYYVPSSPVKCISRKKSKKIDTTDMKSAKPEEGENLLVSEENEKIFYDDEEMRTFEITANNKGVIHLVAPDQFIADIYDSQSVENSQEYNDSSQSECKMEPNLGPTDGKNLKANRDLVDFDFEKIIGIFGKYDSICFDEGSFAGYELVSFLHNYKIARCEKRIDIVKDNYKLKLTVYSPDKTKSIVFYITLGYLDYRSELDHINDRICVDECDLYGEEVECYNAILKEIENVEIFEENGVVPIERDLFLSNSNLPKGFTYSKGCCDCGYDMLEDEEEFLLYKNYFETVEIRDGIKDLSLDSLSNLPNVKEVVVPGSVVCIFSENFSGSGFETIIIEDGVKRIFLRAFVGCDNLKRVRIPTTAFVDPEVFYGCKADILIEYDNREYNIEDFKKLVRPFRYVADFDHTLYTLEQVFEKLKSNGVVFEFMDNICSRDIVTDFNTYCKNEKICVQFNGDKCIPLTLEVLSDLLERIGIKFEYKHREGVRILYNNVVLYTIYTFEYCRGFRREIKELEMYLESLNVKFFKEIDATRIHIDQEVLEQSGKMFERYNLNRMFSQIYLLQ